MQAATRETCHSQQDQGRRDGVVQDDLQPKRYRSGGRRRACHVQREGHHAKDKCQRKVDGCKRRERHAEEEESVTFDEPKRGLVEVALRQHPCIEKWGTSASNGEKGEGGGAAG